MNQLTQQRVDELNQLEQDMYLVASWFYNKAVHLQNHTFIEFCGLMTEYIKICDNTLKSGLDYTQCSIHTGQALVMEPYHLNYLNEKLECIFGITVSKLLTSRGEESREGSESFILY